MKLDSLSALLLLVVGVSCEIESCVVQVSTRGLSKAWTGRCQLKKDCMKSGLAAVAKNSDGDNLCGDDDSVQCCVEIQCGDNKCQNNVESNPCASGTYLKNFRDRALCPHTSPEDNLQCCVVHIDSDVRPELKPRQFGGSSFDDIQLTADDFNSGDSISATLPDLTPGAGDQQGAPIIGSAAPVAQAPAPVAPAAPVTPPADPNDPSIAKTAETLQGVKPATIADTGANSAVNFGGYEPVALSAPAGPDNGFSPTLDNGMPFIRGHQSSSGVPGVQYTGGDGAFSAGVNFGHLGLLKPESYGEGSSYLPTEGYIRLATDKVKRFISKLRL